MWRNLKRITRLFSRNSAVWNGENKASADRQFKIDLNQVCDDHGWVSHIDGCYATASTFFVVVASIPPYYGPSAPAHFHWS
jgi:hypothetical protein